MERLIIELAAHYRYVVIDVGPDWLGTDVAAANHRAVLASAQQVLLVSASDLVGLWHTRTALDQLERQLGIERQNVQLVLNRHDARFHHSASEVAWHLGAPVSAVIPFDHAAAQRAIAQQRPLIVDSQGNVFFVGKNGQNVTGGFGTITVQQTNCGSIEDSDDEDNDEDADRDEDQRLEKRADHPRMSEDHVQPLNRFLEYDPGYVSPTKEALKMLGLDCGPVRRPLPDFPVAERPALQEALAALAQEVPA